MVGGVMTTSQANKRRLHTRRQKQLAYEWRVEYGQDITRLAPDRVRLGASITAGSLRAASPPIDGW